MMLQREAATLCISTVLGSENSYSKLMNRVDRTGKTIFLPVRVSLSCTDPSCGKSGDLCWHIAPWIPAWHSIASHETARSLLSDSVAIRNRELMGVTTDDGERCFAPELVDAAFAWPPLRPSSGRVRFCVIAVDPNNGGNSNYAITSAVYSETSMIITGLDLTADGNVESHERMFTTHVRMLAKLLENVHIFLAVEANCGADCPGTVEMWMRSLGHTEKTFTSLCECGGTGERARKRRGIWTHASFKRAATNDLRNSLKEGRIKLAKRFFSAEGREFYKDAQQQLKQWSEYSEPPKLAGGSAKQWIGGKGINGSMPDDLGMAVIINHAVSRMLMGVVAARYNVQQFSQTGVFHDD
jgi:hypothetical protein